MTECVAILVNDVLVTYSDRLLYSYDKKVIHKDIKKYADNEYLTILRSGSNKASYIVVMYLLNQNVFFDEQSLTLNIQKALNYINSFDRENEIRKELEECVSFICYLKNYNKLYCIEYNKESKEIKLASEWMVAIGNHPEKSLEILQKNLGQTKTTSLEKTKKNIRQLHRKFKKSKFVGKNYDLYQQ